MRFQVDAESAGTRLDRFLSEQVDTASRSLIQAWIRAGRLRIDGEVERKGSRKLRGAEVLELEPAEREPLRAKPEAIDISILFEDDHLAVVDKPAGMVVHASAGHQSGVLVNALLHRLTKLSKSGGPLRPGLVHRLDRFTSGLLVVAKHDAAHRRLQAQFQQRAVGKLYWAAVEGLLPADPRGDATLLRHGRAVKRDGVWWLRVDRPIGRDRRKRSRMAVAGCGREAVSDLRRLRVGSRHSLVAVQLHTGRTHQARVHLASVGHPVVGDPLYGARREAPELPGLDRFLLHARRLAFSHPASGEPLSFEAPLPADFESRLAALGL